MLIKSYTCRDNKILSKQHNKYIKSNPNKFNPKCLNYANKINFNGSNFKLLNHYKTITNVDNLLDLVQEAGMCNGHQILDHLLGTHSKHIKTNPEKNNKNSIELYEKGLLGLIWEGASYPIIDLPFNILNQFLYFGNKTCQKLNINKNIFKFYYNSNFFVNKRTNKDSYEMALQLKGMLEQVLDILESDHTKTSIYNAILKENTGDNINYKKDEIKRMIDKVIKDKHNIKKPPDLSKLTENDRNLYQKVSDNFNKLIFKISQSNFNPKIGKYNSVHERALNRIVSGMVTALFLSYDAYNLATLYNASKDEANKDKNERLKQECLRVGLTAYLQLISLGTLPKLVNTTAWVSPLISASIVLVSETYSRLAQDKPIFFISKQEAKKYNKKQNQNTKKSDKNTNSRISSQNFKGNTINKKEKEDCTIVQRDKNKKNEGFLTLDTLYCYLSLSIGIGILSNTVNKSPIIQKKMKDILNYLTNFISNKNFYESIKKASNDKGTGIEIKKFLKALYKNIDDKLMKKNYIISNEEMDRFINNIETAGFHNLANKYKTVIENNNKVKSVDKKGVNLGKEYCWYKIPIDFIKGIPKFFVDIFNYPYKIFVGCLSVLTEIKPIKESHFGKDLRNFFEIGSKSQDTNVDELTIVRNAYKDLSKIFKKMTVVERSNYIAKSMKSAFNNQNKSKTSNAELAMSTKIISSLVTSYFLVADNYNTVMIKSDGENQEAAKQEAQARIVQRISDMMYGVLFMTLFNSTFESQYHKSLTGMSLVTTVSQASKEIVGRASIGIPVLPKTKEEILDIEERHEKAKGIEGKYFKLMSKITGKKPLTERRKDS